MYDDTSEREPPTTKTVKQSAIAIAIALGLGIAVVLLLQIHYLASEIGALALGAATMGTGWFVSSKVYKLMDGYHPWARLAVAIIIFFAVAVLIGGALEAHHLSGDAE